MYASGLTVVLASLMSAFAHSDPPPAAIACPYSAEEGELSLGRWALDLRFDFGETTPGTFGLELVGGPVLGLMLSGDPAGWWGGSALVVLSMTAAPRIYVAIGPAMASPRMDVGALETPKTESGAVAVDTRVGVDLGRAFAELSLVAGSRYEEDRPWSNIAVPRLTVGIKLGD